MNIHENIYGTPLHLFYNNAYEGIFDEKYYNHTDEKQLSCGYSLSCRRYYRVTTDGISSASCVCCGMLTLFSPEGAEIFAAKVYNDDSAFDMAVLIPHTDGRHYFVYRENMFGYSVLCTETMDEMHYLPMGRSDSGDTMGSSHILGSFHYDPKTSLCAASCGQWGAGQEIALFDLSSPLKEPVKITLLCDFIDPRREEYRRLCFKAWRDKRLIIGTDKGEELSFTEDILKKFLLISCGK